MANDFKYDILDTYGVIGEGDYVTKVRKISWNDREPVIDIRKWKSDDSRMGKGISLSLEDIGSLVEILVRVEADDDLEPMSEEEMLAELENQYGM